MGSDTRQAEFVMEIARAEETFRKLYETHRSAVYAYCLRRTDEFSAQDAVSEVFTVVWKKIGQCPSEPVVRAWLYGIAYRVLGHQWRGRNRRRRLERRLAGDVVRVEPSPEGSIVQRSEDRLVLEAARRLRHNDQEILRLAGWEELAHTEIAAMLGISVAAVDQRFSRAKKRLAGEYDKLASRGTEKPGNDRGST
jgi:RNA polymerase sigma-70 factor (ECF subfamily)